jgi:hypothetical protein
MPHGVDYLDVQIGVDDAWDIAAYVLSHPRPHLVGLDFPNLLSKPVDTPYGPYADHFNEIRTLSANYVLLQLNLMLFPILRPCPERRPASAGPSPASVVPQLCN